MQEFIGNSNSMEIATTLQLLIGLMVLLFFLLMILLYRTKYKRKSPKNERRSEEQHPSLESLLQRVSDENISRETLEETLQKIVQYHPEIQKKTFSIYAKILLKVCTHPQTSKDIILLFNQQLEKLNPSFKREINEYIMQGLNRRTE